ncbi:PREDICTED: F-box protein At5g07610-like [Nicotiana attenuata]|uniref:F-box protein n=1 Tax=Nicotiana attenuata TaxID=49451 RepID=A0A1J6IF63_NICAT|nr:PREDICTED: F-box protein At5g07610-like [Nicotiana attenuata]XP_019245580.1 PREDICTED: F-box protein At5g07610-like [Nicotiana attenuata]OIT03274.1 f-box protein [Nicotiana attenuata]
MEESHIDKRLVVTAAVDVIAGNVDLLSEILLRLPARSLIKFSLVCKLWFSIINSMQFRVSHCRALAFSSAPTPSGIYFYNCLTNLQKVESLPLTYNVTSLPPLQFLEVAANIGDGIKVTQSCNGLLMCVISTKTEVSELKLGIVYNPAKNEYHKLPNPYVMYYEVVYGYSLIFDPSEPPYYKALCIKRLGTTFKGHFFGTSDYEVSVYVPGNKSWRSCCRFSPPYGMRFDSGVFWNGGIHWIGEYSSVYFDAKSEEVVVKNMPPRPQGYCSEKIRYFGEWGGHLHLIQVQSLYAKKFNVLELDKDTWKWSVKYRVHLARLISAFPEIVQQTAYGTQYAFSILSVIRGENEEDSVLLLTIPGKVVAYNLVLKTAKVVRELPGEIGETLRFNPVSAYQYAESLVPVKDWTIRQK